MPRSKLCENGPEIVEKKTTVAHSIPDETPRKNKKVRSIRGTESRDVLLFPDFSKKRHAKTWHVMGSHVISRHFHGKVRTKWGLHLNIQYCI
jgi:hypothetical protein